MKTLKLLRIPIVLKYFVGVVLLQGMTALLLFAWSQSATTDTGLTFAALALAAGLFAALWFATLARGDRKEALLRAEANLSRERERHRRRSDRERAKAVEAALRQGKREAGRAQTRANLKLGGAAIGMVGLGVALLLTQFLSLGVLLVSSSGGAVAGYLWRARQDARRQLGTARPETPGIIPSAPRMLERGDPEWAPKR